MKRREGGSGGWEGGREDECFDEGETLLFCYLGEHAVV